jgi:DNA invertase Pin-like site-specific DNA recombinase
VGRQAFKLSADCHDACCIGDLQDIVRALRAKGASLKATEQPIDTAAGKCFLDMLGVFAEFETNLRNERQR